MAYNTALQATRALRALVGGSLVLALPISQPGSQGNHAPRAPEAER